MKKLGYDPRCGDLARYFFEQKPTPENKVSELAQAIQDTIEDYLNEDESATQRNSAMLQAVRGQSGADQNADGNDPRRVGEKSRPNTNVGHQYRGGETESAPARCGEIRGSILDNAQESDEGDLDVKRSLLDQLRRLRKRGE